jgi:hypothetical protein
VVPGVVDIGIWLKGVWNEWKNALILIKGEAVKNLVATDLPVQAPNDFGFAEG